MELPAAGRRSYSLLSQQEPISGSSFAGSSLSNADHCPPSDPDEDEGSRSKNKSWAQQTEESYQLQLALALRLTKDATCADDPNFLDPFHDTSQPFGATVGSVEALALRFWVNGCLSYYDKVPDGFFTIHGMDPYVWSICTDLQKDGRIPSVELLKGTSPGSDSSIETILIDMRNDHRLKELQRTIHGVSRSCNTKEEVVDRLAKIVSNQMGGASPAGENDLVLIWKNCSDNLQQCLGSVVLPIGSLSVGLCRHRALLFKVLADYINLPCRIAKGCKYCSKDDAASCLVRFDPDREYLVDLIGNPGCLCEPDSSLNGPSSIMISSPLCFPRGQQVEPIYDSKSLAKQFFEDFESLDIEFDDPSTDSAHPKLSERPNVDGGGHLPRSADSNEHYDTLESTKDMIREMAPPNHYLPTGRREVQHRVSMFGSGEETSEGLSFVQVGQPSEMSLDIEDLDIPWTDLVLKETIGEGSFGVVHRGDWQGSDVAVKKLMDQDFHPQRLMEFYKEVSIMKRLRHPNIVLFMGAVTKPPNLSIVTEYLSRGSLYRLLHKSGERKLLDEKRRLNMAYDVARGMNYLHNRNPPIVHRDLKSPNLLVDKKYTVKVCDFGLSRLKANTYLSSKSAAGTPEWMAPEVLRSEPSNEKSDVYSFGVVLWELFTLRKPWSNLKAPQVVAAVGFQSKRLEIPRNINPQVALMIEACWASEPINRPSFASIMESLKNLIKSSTTQPVHAEMHYLHD